MKKKREARKKKKQSYSGVGQEMSSPTSHLRGKGQATTLNSSKKKGKSGPMGRDECQGPGRSARDSAQLDEGRGNTRLIPVPSKDIEEEGERAGGRDAEVALDRG